MDFCPAPPVYVHQAAEKNFPSLLHFEYPRIVKSMQLEFDDDLVTEVCAPVAASPRRLRTANRCSGARTILILVLIACACLSCARNPRSPDPKDVALIVIPPDSAIVENSDWVKETWSARKAYTFESQLTQAEYLTWAKLALGPGWHCHGETDGAILFTRLLSGEQQNLELRAKIDDSKHRICVSVTFTATAT